MPFIQRQSKLLGEVIEGLREQKVDTVDIHDIAKVMKQLKEEIKVAKPDDLPHLFHQLNLQQTLADRYAKGIAFPDFEKPYFAYMKIQESEKEKIILLGEASFHDLKDRFRIVDWKRAPIAKLFYEFDEGEEYEIDTPNGTREGTLLEACLVTIERGELYRIDRGKEAFYKLQGEWQSKSEVYQTLGGGQGQAAESRRLGTGLTDLRKPDVLGMLDRTQYEILEAPPSEPLLLIGGAGSGKTTVALYRLAVLASKYKMAQDEMIVLVPHRGLVTLSREILASVGLKKVKIVENQGWFQNLAREYFNLKKLKVNIDTPFAVSAIKRSRPLFYALKDYLREMNREFFAILKKEFEHFGRTLPDTRGYSSRDAFVEILRVAQSKDQLLYIKVREQIKEFLSPTYHLRNFLTSKSKLEAIVDGEKITHRMVKHCLEYTARQLRDVENFDYSDKTIDGKNIDDQTSSYSASSFDQEDFPLMLWISGELLGQIGTLTRSARDYQHIIIDEAQELSPFDQGVLKKLRKKDGQVTVAGDEVQQVDPALAFLSWEDFLKSLGIHNYSLHQLEVSYRSPRPIIELAHKVLGPLAPSKMPNAIKDGPPVRIDSCPHEAKRSMLLEQELKDLLLREPQSQSAIICSSEDEARSLFEKLSSLGGQIRLVLDANFSFKPGIDITVVENIRGLEFDYVVIPDATELNYTFNAYSRKRLHLAMTRAIHQLWILSTGNQSALI